MSAGRMTRRGLLARGLCGAVAVSVPGLAAGCGAGSAMGAGADPRGSTLRTTWRDPGGSGELVPAPGEPMIARTELGGVDALVTRPLLTLVHIADAHVLDASSPARVTFLDRLGPPFQSTFRPQEALTAQVLAGAVRAVRALAPALVVQGGDLVDNDQANEMDTALAALRGGVIVPAGTRHGYAGVQLAADTDPFYYRPEIDAPRHPGLLRSAARPFLGAGTGAPLVPVLGDHDALVAGELVPTATTRSLAVGDRALWDLPAGLSLPPGARAAAALSPDGPPAAGLVDPFLRAALAGPTVAVPADPGRREMTFAEALARVSRPASPAARPRTDASGQPRLDYVIDAGRVRLVVLDLVRRDGGSGGLVESSQPAFLRRALAGAAGRWVIVVSHQPIEGSVGGEELLATLDGAPRVIATLSGHTHRNAIAPRVTAAGGCWQVSTASLIDYPQQARVLSVHATARGGVAIRTWMLDHVGGRLAEISRRLAYLDAQGGRPQGFAGRRLDRNAVLFRRAG